LTPNDRKLGSPGDQIVSGAEAPILALGHAGGLICLLGRLNATVAPYILFVSILGMPVKTAKIFKHGNSQAVRLPKEFRFDGDEVFVKRSGGGVLLLPKKITYEQIMEVVNQFKGAVVRRQPPMQKRRWR
jgi:antitoxin VapB